jgi:hypothetical protein
MKTWLSVSKWAQYADVRRNTIYMVCERRDLNHARVGGRRASRLKAVWSNIWVEGQARRVREPQRVDTQTSGS